MRYIKEANEALTGILEEAWDQIGMKGNIPKITVPAVPPPSEVSVETIADRSERIALSGENIAGIAWGRGIDTPLQVVKRISGKNQAGLEEG